MPGQLGGAAVLRGWSGPGWISRSTDDACSTRYAGRPDERDLAGDHPAGGGEQLQRHLGRRAGADLHAGQPALGLDDPVQQVDPAGRGQRDLGDRVPELHPALGDGGRDPVGLVVQAGVRPRVGGRVLAVAAVRGARPGRAISTVASSGRRPPSRRRARGRSGRRRGSVGLPAGCAPGRVADPCGRPRPARPLRRRPVGGSRRSAPAARLPRGRGLGPVGSRGRGPPVGRGASPAVRSGGRGPRGCGAVTARVVGGRRSGAVGGSSRRPGRGGRAVAPAPRSATVPGRGAAARRAWGCPPAPTGPARSASAGGRRRRAAGAGPAPGQQQRRRRRARAARARAEHPPRHGEPDPDARPAGGAVSAGRSGTIADCDVVWPATVIDTRTVAGSVAAGGTSARTGPAAASRPGRTAAATPPRSRPRPHDPAGDPGRVRPVRLPGPVGHHRSTTPAVHQPPAELGRRLAAGVGRTGVEQHQPGLARRSGQPATAAAEIAASVCRLPPSGPR